MLHLIIENGQMFESTGCTVYDADAEFFKVKIPKTPYAELAMSVIDQATYHDPWSFVDRYGVKLSKDKLSTGCKVALLTAINSDKLTHSIECGINARDFIVCNCTEGNLVIWKPSTEFSDLTTSRRGNISVELDGKIFTDLNSLNEYLF